MASVNTPPLVTAIADKDTGLVSTIWHRFFMDLQAVLNNINSTESIPVTSAGSNSGEFDSLEDNLQLLSELSQGLDISGNNTEIQFNYQGSLGSDSRFTWDKLIGVLETVGGRIHSETRIINTDSPYTLLTTDNVIFADTDGGNITINIPAGISGTCYEWYNVGSSGNTLTVDPNGTETLLGGGAGVSATFEDEEGAITKYNSTNGWR